MTKKQKRAKRANYKKRYCLNKKLLIALVAFFIASMSFFTAMVDAKSPEAAAPTTHKYYTSVQIESGDSLWSIAECYCPEDVEIRDYIKELKKMNGIKSDKIHTGNYLTVYYCSEPL